MKSMNKKDLRAKGDINHAVTEANILKMVDCPFIICLHYAFQVSLLEHNRPD